MKKKLLLSLISLVIISTAGCSEINSNHEEISSNSEYVFDENEIKEQNLEGYNDVIKKHEESSNTMDLAIKVDDKGDVLESANVKIVSAIYETGKIEHFSGFDEHWQTIYHYENYFNDDGILKPEFVFAEVTIEINCNKSYDELYLTGFTLDYLSNGEALKIEPRLIDKCIDYDNPHKGMVISIEADKPKIVTLGYPIYKKNFDTITEVYLYGRFALFTIMDNADGSLPVIFSKAE